MSYLCLKCYKVYKNKPKKNCCKDAIEIDELMIPSIILLNKKGYKTEFCCSGHIYDDVCCPYITFSSSFNNVLSEVKFKEIFNNIPTPWHIEYGDCMGRKTLRYNMIFMKDIIETQKIISDANAMILDYINTLPSLTESI